MTIPRIFLSSVNPEKFSLTLKGLVPLLGFLATLYGVEFPQEDFLGSVDALVKVFVTVGAAVSAVVTLYGAVRKALVALGLYEG